jgi:hypothetical protein
MTRAAYLPSGIGVSVRPVEINNISDIQELVGGHFDAVRKDCDGVMAVGYVHDEGLLLDMEPNYLASALFMREIRGNVVVVNGYNENGEYDGESYDLPTEFVLFLATNFTEKVAEAYNMATVTAMALEYCDANNLATAEELEQLLKEINAYVDDPNRTKEQGSAIDDKVNALIERANEKLLGEATETLFDEIDEFLENGGK